MTGHVQRGTRGLVPAHVARTWPGGAQLLVALCAAAYFVTLLKGAWLSDDYFITLRQVEQLFAGHGIRFNLYERVFLSTSVLYFLILLPLRLVTSDPFLLYGIFALTCNALLLWLLWLLGRRNVYAWLLGVGLLLGCKAYFDYSWFGQENPLGHVLVAALVLTWLRLYPELRRRGAPVRLDWHCFVALIAIAPLYRHDFVLLAWPLAAWALWDNRSRLGWVGLARTVGWMLLPLLIWTGFSLVYFGFPLPSTAYNKLSDSYPILLRVAPAWDYYRFSLNKDGLMMAVLFGSQLLWLGRAPAKAIGAAIALVLLYVVFVGGDYMGGRFLTVAYVMLVCLVSGTSSDWHRFLAARYGRSRCGWMLAGLAVALVSWVAVWPDSPLRSPVIYEARVVDRENYPTEVANERAAWQRHTGIAVWWSSLRNGTAYPDHVTARLGILLRNEAASGETFHVCNLGVTPYKAKLDQNFLDVWGLADSFMTRLPGTGLRASHLARARPLGLAESIASGSPSFVDPGLNRYFEILRNVTGSERLLSGERVKDVIGLNLGLYDDLLAGPIESWESPAIMPNTENVPLLKRMLQSYPRNDKLPETPLCFLVDHPEADTLLRRHIP